MRILFVLELYYPNIGGNEKLFKTLAESLVGQGHQVQVVTTLFRKDLLKKETLNGVRIRRLNYSSRFLFTFFAIFHLGKYARDADLIHTTSYNAALPAWLAAKLCRKKVIITFHEVWGKLWFRLPFISTFLKNLYYLYERFILNLNFDRFIAVSDYTRNALLNNKISEDKIIRIYNGLEPENYARISVRKGHPFIFTFFGRLGISKGLDILVRAAEDFLITHPDSRLKLIVPQNPLSLLQKVHKLIEGAGIGKHVVFQYNLSNDELLDSLADSNCVVIPSYSEGFCYAAAECIAMGIPVISSDQGALKEVVSGTFIKMHELSPEALASALQQAYNGYWESTPIRKFYLSDTVSNYEKCYAGLVS